MTRRLRLYLTLCILLTTLCVSPYAAAQREKHNIYLFDCTGSMRSGGLWQAARDALDETVRVQSAIPGSTFVVVPFGDAPYEVFRFDYADYAGEKDRIFKAFDTYIVKAKHTRITEALRGGTAEVNPKKENRIYLLTDGKPDGDTPERVAAFLDEWCASHRNARIFYVALRENIIDPVIAAAVDRCRDIVIVPCRDGVIPQIADIAGDIHASTEELGTDDMLRFSIPLAVTVEVACDDPLFEAEIPGGKTRADGTVAVRLRARGGLSPEELHTRMTAETAGAGDYAFTLRLTSADPHYIIANPTVSVNMADHVQSRLTLAGGEAEISADDCRWHDSFLWAGASEPTLAEFDLSPVFKGAAADARLTLSVDADNPDFRVTVNGRETAPGDAFDIRRGEPCVLSVTFDTDAAEGKRYITLKRRSCSGIDLINDAAADDFTGFTLRTRYTVEWNPLRTALTWMGIILAAALVLWLAWLRRVVYPRIRVSRMELRGPGTYYLAPRKIKGARKVVLTARRRRQNAVARLFTGRIIYLTAPHFTPDITILPAGRGKRVKIQGGGAAGWTATPSAMVAPFQSATLTHDNNKFTLDIS